MFIFASELFSLEAACTNFSIVVSKLICFKVDSFKEWSSLELELVLVVLLLLVFVVLWWRKRRLNDVSLLGSNKLPVSSILLVTTV